MSIGRSPTQYKGVLAKQPPDLIFADRAPVTGSDIAFRKGDIWLDSTDLTSFQFAGDTAGTWIALGTGAVGGIVTLTGGSGGALSPTAGNFNLLGTANQITSTGAGSTITFSVPATFIAPGTIASTTTITAGTALVATTTVTGGTGVVATTGNISASAGNVSASGTVTGGTGVIATTGNVSATAGAVNAGTSMTATAGDITATLGNVVVNGAAKHFSCHGGAVTDFIGQAVLVNGTVTVANTNIAATDRIFVTRSAKNASTAYGSFQVVITAATNFIITSCKSDTTTETNDASTVDYIIVRQV